MPPSTPTSPHIQEILDSRKVHVFFQPVVSVERRSIIGFEAYARGGGASGPVVKPQDLFDPGLEPDVQLEIDRICRENALERFKAIADKHKNVLLFLNINAAALRSNLLRSDYLAEQATRHGIEPHRVAIEIPVEQLGPAAPYELADQYRKLGFRFSLDGGDATTATLNIMHRLQPDFLKTPRPGNGDDSRGSFGRELLQALAENVQRIGCRLIGKGVETEDDAFKLLDAGIFLQQGFYYTKSDTGEAGKDALAVFKEKIHEVHSRYRENQVEQIKAKRAGYEGLHKTTAKACYRCEKTVREEFQDLALSLVHDLETAFSVFLLDTRGQEAARAWKDSAGAMDARLGMAGDHSIRDYYLHLKTGFERFVTAPFVSPATKKRHTIVARRFFNAEGDEYILGIEFLCPVCTAGTA